MNILILGGNGRVGSQVAEQLLKKRHKVTVTVHKHTKEVPDGAKILKIDLTDEASIVNALRGIDAVVCALSSWGSPTHNVLSTTIPVVIMAMKKTGVKRIVTISGDVARVPGENPSLFTKVFHIFAVGTIRKVITDSEEHVRQLSDSKLDWTTIRPTIMSSSKKAGYVLQLKHPANPFIPRVAVVASIVGLLENNDHLQEAPFIRSHK